MSSNICSVFAGDAIVSEAELSEVMQSLKCKGIKAVASSCERGFPMTALSAAYKAGLDMIVVIPYEGQAESWSEELRRRYLDIQLKASQRFMISEEYTAECGLLADHMLMQMCRIALVSGENSRIQTAAERLERDIIVLRSDVNVRVI